MSTYAIKLVLENQNLLGFSEYIISYTPKTEKKLTIKRFNFSSSTATILGVTHPEQAYSQGELTTVYLIENVYPDTEYIIEVKAVYTDGTTSPPATITHKTSKISFDSSNINLEFTRTLYNNIQIVINSNINFNILYYKINRYSSIYFSNGVYTLKKTYTTKTKALDIPDYSTNDYFSVEPIIYSNFEEVSLGESKFFQCPLNDTIENLLTFEWSTEFLKIIINSPIQFDFGKLQFNTTQIDFVNNICTISYQKIKELINLNDLEFYIILYKNYEQILQIEYDLTIPSNTISNLLIRVTKAGINVKFPNFIIPIKKYYIESKALNEEAFTEIYSGNSPEFIDTKTYQKGVTYKVRVLDYFDRWSDFYIESLEFKPPAPPKRITFKADKLTKNISLFWDYEYPSEDYIEIKEFEIVTNNRYYKTIDKSYVLPLTEDIKTIAIKAIDVLNQKSLEEIINLDIPKPPDPTNLRAVQVGNLISLYWDFPYYEYLECFEVKVNGWDFVNVFKTITSTSVTFEVIQTGTVDFYVKAKSIIGDYSENFAKTTITILPNFYTNNVYTYTSQSDNWESCSIVNLTTQGTLLVSNDIEKATATIFFPPITYNSICRSTNYFSADLVAIKKLFYKWSDFSDDDSDDPFPSTYKWSDLRFEKWVVSSEKTEIGSWYILPVQNDINDSNFYQLENSLYNSTNTNKLSTTLGDQYVTFKSCFLTKGIQVTQDSTNKLNNILIPINYGISFNALVNFNNGSVLGKLTNGNQFCVIGVSNHIISLSGTYTNYIELSNIDFQHILTVKIKQNIINFIINNQLYSITLPFTPTTFIYGGF